MPLLNITESAPLTSDGGSARKQALARVLLPTLLLNLLLLSPTLLPAFSEINPHDEAKYIQSGAALLQGEVRDLAWGPLVAVVYAPLHAVFGDMANGFVLEAWAGRVVLYAALLLGTFYLGLQLAGRPTAFVLAGTLFGSIPFLTVVVNQSDAVFTSLSAAALGQLVAFHREGELRDVWIGSALVALAALARVEAVVLIVLFVAMAFWLDRRRLPLKRLLPAAVLPAVGILAVYLLVFRITSGGFDLGLRGKAYDSFEMNQSVLTGGDIALARQETTRLFGAPDANQGSVLRAILRNPPAFAARILANVRSLPDQYLGIFGKTLGPLLAIFAVWGMWRLLGTREWIVVAIFAIWALQPAISLGFLALHFVPQLSYLPLVLAAVGIGYVLSDECSPTDRTALLVITAALGLYGLADQRPAFLAAGLLSTAAIGLGWLIRTPPEDRSTVALAPAMLLLGAGLILRGPFDFPNYPSLGDSAEEQAVRHLQLNFPAGSRVLVPYPLPALAAGMVDIVMSDVPADLTCAASLHDWLLDQNVVAVYLDARLGTRPDIAALVAAGEDAYFRRSFTSEDIVTVHTVLATASPDTPGEACPP